MPVPTSTQPFLRTSSTMNDTFVPFILWMLYVSLTLTLLTSSVLVAWLSVGIDDEYVG